jgi:hypothetical protein
MYFFTLNANGISKEVIYTLTITDMDVPNRSDGETKVDRLLPKPSVYDHRYTEVLKTWSTGTATNAVESLLSLID